MHQVYELILSEDKGRLLEFHVDDFRKTIVEKL